MIRSQTKTQPKTHEQQMKYRLTGAAIIVGFAIIVISVLLKEPNIALDTKFANNAGDSKQTFKLEIPLPSSADDADNRTSGYGDDVKSALLEPELDITVTDQIPTTVGGSEGKDAGKSIVLTKDAKQDSTAKPVSFSSKSAKPTKSDTPQPEESSSDIAKDGSGWTVRVGTYTKTENVDRVSALLKSHGFDPRHAKVKTALGAATRIWLGPYTKKKTAEKVSTRLKLITGEKGYVTEQSS